MPDTRTRLGPTAIKRLIAAALVALGAAALLLNLPGAGKGGGPLKGQPVPALFADHAIAIVPPITAAARARADRDIRAYLAAHPAPDDAAFTAFALSHVGPPPSARVQRAELRRLHAIDAGRTPAGITAATWLEAHGKKDIWKLYLKQYAQQVAKPQAKTAKAQFKHSLALANTLAADGKTRFARPSPYITDPALHALNQQRFAKKYSYPAKHGVISFALAPLLARLEPHRAGEFRWMTDEVGYSRLYAGGHYPSDLAAGAYLGTLISDYVRQTSA